MRTNLKLYILTLSFVLPVTSSASEIVRSLNLGQLVSATESWGVGNKATFVNSDNQVSTLECTNGGKAGRIFHARTKSTIDLEINCHTTVLELRQFITYKPHVKVRVEPETWKVLEFEIEI